MKIERGLLLDLICAATAVCLGCLHASEGNPVRESRAALAPVIGTWAGVDTFSGVVYYRLEIRSDGTGFLGKAANRFPTDVWRVRQTLPKEGGVFELSLTPVEEGTQQRAGSIIVRQHWATRVLELQMVILEDGYEGKSPKTAERILLRQKGDLQEMERDIVRKVKRLG